MTGHRASTLVVTNDFPPRQGGIETFVHAMATRLPGGVVVYTSREPGSAAFDAKLPFPVVRDGSRMLLPTARVTARAAAIARAHGCDRVWFGAAAPLALMAGALRAGGNGPRGFVATTHGHEIWWARTPGARRMMRRIGDEVDVVTYLGPYTRARIAPALGPRARLSRLVPGVDSGVFRPDAAARAEVRAELGLGDAPVILCVARLVPRKGQDVLIRALPQVRRAVPGTVLLILGHGPDERRLRRLARRHADEQREGAGYDVERHGDGPYDDQREDARRDGDGPYDDRRHHDQPDDADPSANRRHHDQPDDADPSANRQHHDGGPSANQRRDDGDPPHRRDAPVRFLGGRAHAETPAYYAAADVFAMPCRTRRGGLEAEGLGIVFLEAAASGLPVVAGNSGGAPDTVLDGRTGHVVDGRDPSAVADALTRVLLAPDRAALGAAGRLWAADSWSWDASARHLAHLLTPPAAD